MAIQESKLRIVEDNIPNIAVPVSVRHARVAAPLLSEASATVEEALFKRQHHPDRLALVRAVELVNPAKDVIGGALIYDAFWFRRPVWAAQEVHAAQEVQAVREVLGDAFTQQQRVLPPALQIQ